MPFNWSIQVERTNAEVELALNKLKTEEASLRDQLAKMQALNEGLAQDKVDLHKVISDVSFVCIEDVEHSYIKVIPVYYRVKTTIISNQKRQKF